jgi:arginyl-tRNA synthetase
MSLAVRTVLAAALSDAFVAVGLERPERVNLERPASPEHGDWSSNVAMATAKKVGRNPRELAGELTKHLNEHLPSHTTAVEIAGPGFINFRLAPTWLHDVLKTVVGEGQQNYARLSVAEARRVNLEYVSANPTGPLHAGHARWAAYGDALARTLMRAGYSVHREFYINDRGVQMRKFAESLLARQTGTAVPDGGYQGQYIIDWAQEMPAGLDVDAALEWGYAKALAYQRDTMRRMNVEFDTFSSERKLAASGAVEATLGELERNGHVYRAVVAEKTSDRDPAQAKGAVNEDGGPGGTATWLRTTSFVDPKRNKSLDDGDRALVKGDGQYTYFTPDIAYHRDKYQRGDLLIDMLGADHHGYVGRMKAAMMALGHAADDLEILIGQNCVLMRDGVEVKLSKRTGDIIELAELIDEFGADAAKLTFLLQSIDTRQTVDLDALVAKSLDNPVFYVHYAHARVHGIGRKAAEKHIVRVPMNEVNLGLLVHERELDVLRVLADLPDVVAIAAHDRAPHKITTWVRELAGAFQSMYHDCPILRDDIDEPLRQARLWLVEAARIGLAIGLDLLGVSAPEKMDDLPAE